jgi:hypothetical protein
MRRRRSRWAPLTESANSSEKLMGRPSAGMDLAQCSRYSSAMERPPVGPRSTLNE